MNKATLSLIVSLVTISIICIDKGIAQDKTNEKIAHNGGVDVNDIKTPKESYGDAVAGKSKASTCVPCHDINGVGMTAKYPNLGGQGERYLIKQLTDINEGTRSIPEMIPFTRNLSQQDIKDIAAHYSSLPVKSNATNPKHVPLGEDLYRSGNPQKGIPACGSCHAIEGSGNSLAGFPRLGGQSADYTAQQLRSYSDNTRDNDDTKIMKAIAVKLSNQEIEAVSNYIQGLGKASK